MRQQSQHEQRSILEDLGEEVTGIITPVSICMALTVLLVKTLNPTGASDARSVFIASAFYTEKDTDSTSMKTFGALINASIFVFIVTAMTFLLVFLFKRGYTRVIYGYMCFAGFSIFFVLAGILLLQLLEKFDIAIDAISYLFILYNFAVVGVLGLFVWPAPMTLKQTYLTITGVIVAFVFTWTPEWTTWTLLIAMAIYDMFAVLMPGGPLKELVHIAEERQVDIPALVYEARPVRRDSAEHLHDVASDSAWAHTTRPRRMHDVATGSMRPRTPGTAASGSSQRQSGSEYGAAASEDGQLPGAEVLHMEAVVVGGQQMPVQQSEDTQPLVGPGQRLEQPAGQHGSQEQPPTHQQHSHEQQQEGSYDGGGDMMLLPDAIKLGLGDFIFYSVLVGRAAMYDMLTAYMAYLAIVAGLGATLLLLAMYQKALPALPVSITLGVAFYFAARLLLEPFALSLSTNLVFF